MEMHKLVKIKEQPDLRNDAANWFHEKWEVPLEAYLESMEACINGKQPVPQWYVVLAEEQIIGGAGVIENDFHNRKELAPNICALYVEPGYRCQGFAGQLLQRACDDMKEMGVDTLYLITDHTSFYERYGWEFLCMVQGDDEPDLTRMYIHRTS